MFISVVLPAPFSPSSAWISPRRTSRSMWSLATTPGKRLVTPRISSAAGRVAAWVTTMVPRLGMRQKAERACPRMGRPARQQSIRRSSLGSRRRLTVLVVAGSEGRLDAGLDGPVLEALDGRIDLRLDVRRDHALAVVEGGEAYRVGGDVQRNGAALVGLAVDALNRI